MQGTTHMLPGSHAVAGHGIPFVVWYLLAVGKAMAGRQAVGVEMPLRIAGMPWSERESWIQWPGVERCATTHPQAKRNKCPQRSTP